MGCDRSRAGRLLQDRLRWIRGGFYSTDGNIALRIPPMWGARISEIGYVHPEPRTGVVYKYVRELNIQIC